MTPMDEWVKASKKLQEEIDELELELANLKAGLNRDGSTKTTGSSE